MQRLLEDSVSGPAVAIDEDTVSGPTAAEEENLDAKSEAAWFAEARFALVGRRGVLHRTRDSSSGWCGVPLGDALFFRTRPAGATLCRTCQRRGLDPAGA